MSNAEKMFYQIVRDMDGQSPHVSQGKMMTSPGLRYKTKFFTFYYQDEMVFKLGKEFDPESVSLKHFQYLNPFKNKGPMKSWFQVSVKDKDKWPELAKLALDYVQQEVDG